MAYSRSRFLLRMSPLDRHIDAYVDMRQRLGFKMSQHRERLREFASFLDKAGCEFITVNLALQYAQDTGSTRGAVWFRILVIRGFAQYMRGRDVRTALIPDGLVSYRNRRSSPHLFSQVELKRVLIAAKNIKAGKYRRRLSYVLFGLIAVTGMRPGEALRLKREDVDLEKGWIFIRKTKQGAERVIPVHHTTRRILRLYVKLRDETFPQATCQSFFLAPYRDRNWSTSALVIAFARMVRASGVLPEQLPAGIDRPTMMSLRHRFASENLLRISESGAPINQMLSTLSTYLGHKNASNTYWYVENTPALRSSALLKLEAFWKGNREAGRT